MRDIIICLVIWSIIMLATGYEVKEYKSKEFLKRNSFIIYQKDGAYANEQVLTKNQIEKLSGEVLQ